MLFGLLDKSSRYVWCKGGNCSFRPNTGRGIGRLAPISEIVDPEAGMLMSTKNGTKTSTVGFLLGDSFVVRTDLRFVLNENEENSSSTLPETQIYVVRKRLFNSGIQSWFIVETERSAGNESIVHYKPTIHSRKPSVV